MTFTSPTNDRRRAGAESRTQYAKIVRGADIPFRHLNKSPGQLGRKGIRAYQVYLINEKEVGAQFRGHNGSTTALCSKVFLKKEVAL
jgi:hypothetical protein